MGKILCLLIVWTRLHLLTASPFSPVPANAHLKLSPYILHWEPADYDLKQIPKPNAHHRNAREVNSFGQRPLKFAFKAHGREFRLDLRAEPDSLFAEDVEFQGPHGPLHYDKHKVYTGRLEDDENAVVHGLITSDGLFDGTILLSSGEIFYIEPVDRYFNSSHNPNAVDDLFNIKTSKYHSAVYKSSDVRLPRNENSHTCASEQLHQKRLKEKSIPRSFQKHIDLKDDGHQSRRKRWLPDDIHHISTQHDDYQDDEQEKKLLNPELPLDLDVPYTRNIDEHAEDKKPNSKIFDDKTDKQSPKRADHVEIITKNNIGNKRPTATLVGKFFPSDFMDYRQANKRATFDPNKTTCMLYLQADHKFLEKFGTEEACIDIMTRHVQRVNQIYRTTDFNQDGKPDNITFMIKRIKVHTHESLKDPSYRFADNYGVEKYLELFSEEDYDSFCLAYMFTYRDFEMGTLGLAWTGDLKNAGGVCEKNGHYRGSMKSLNTGIVTLLNYGKHVPPSVSHVTLAHEIGHNFGSPHDPEQCAPGGPDGNFIMFARATSGDKANNDRFSSCSLRSIDPVLNTKARSTKGCFTEPQSSICGNGVVEPGEECDCGWEEDCRDSCCHPQRRKIPPPDETPCTLTAQAVCSPSQGPCCTTACQLRFGDRCRSDNGCRDASYCAGTSALCPPSVNKPNKTICNEDSVCYMGECTGSICLAYGLESCQCTRTDDDPATRSCELCCRVPAAAANSLFGDIEGDGERDLCVSSFHLNEAPFDIPDAHVKPGTPCNDYNGYCDASHVCRLVDPSGPLATLRRLLLSERSLAGLKQWVTKHWYAVALLAAVILAMLVISTKLLGKKPDVKLKSVTIMHGTPNDPIIIPPDLSNNGQVIVHTAVRSKLPLKKRVRDAKFRSKKSKTSLKTRPNGQPNHRAAIETTKSAGHRTAAVAAESPAKLRKKKRVSAAVVASDEPLQCTAEAAPVVAEVAPTKPKKHVHNKRKDRKQKKKEVIDYSAAQTKPSKQRDPICKVQQWLLESPQPTVIPKSKSTPVDLTSRSPNKHNRFGISRNDKCKSIGNLQDKEKMRLQVVYKPPFKFSLKLCKNDHTKVVLDRINKDGAKRSRARENVHPIRTALLVKSKDDNKNSKSGDCTTNASDIAVNIINIPKNNVNNDSLNTNINATNSNTYENVQTNLSTEQEASKRSKKPDAAIFNQLPLDECAVRALPNKMKSSSSSNLDFRHSQNSPTDLHSQNPLGRCSQKLFKSSQEHLNKAKDSDKMLREPLKYYNNDHLKKPKRRLSVSNNDLITPQKRTVMPNDIDGLKPSQCDKPTDFKGPEAKNKNVQTSETKEQIRPNLGNHSEHNNLTQNPIFQQSDLNILLPDNQNAESC